MNNRKKIILGVLLLLYLVVIFVFSNQDATTSQGSSDIIVDAALNATGNDKDNFNLYNNLAFIVRKSTHFFIYGGLAVLFFFNFKEYFTSIKKCMLLSLVSTFLYACTDEFHQTFINGRTGCFADVILDTSGAVVALLVTFLIYTKVKNKNNLKSEDIK